MQLAQQIKLPANFRRADFLSFHQRDQQMLAEQWDDQHLYKGIIWNNAPARLQFTFVGKRAVNVTLDIDTGSKKISTEKTQVHLRQLAQHMLGLNQTTTEFELAAAQHTELAALVAQQSGLRVPQSASPFEALSWAITGQQISVSAVTSLRRKLIERAGIRHSSGILCYPGAEQIITLNISDLRACGFSQTKAITLLSLAQLSQSGQLPLTQWLEDYWNGKPLAADEIFTQLTSVKGIGPWTVHYALLRGFSWLDGSLHGDVAVRRNLQRLLTELKIYSGGEKISELDTKNWLAGFSPWRALVAAHLWAMQKADGY